ncbi:MAG: hypothetical protein JWO33_188 [Caulobacteraceae bacterium]|nr:hypothetical protein [Caulobacteraceae bacterium]
MTATFRPANVVKAGLAGGMVDFVYGSVRGALDDGKVVQVWQSVASGWLGKASYQLGWTSLALGVVTHFGIAIVMAAAYALAALKAPLLLRRPWLCGAAYGLVLYGVMYRIVLPLRWPAAFPKWNGGQSVVDIAAHVGVGLAIALVLARSATAKR